ncbi:YhfG family protein [Gilvimarinus algae]|uniref:YhfG family protein n=1 Tax=Gilvimarinus algae TaxID=3058037 RepID=UPI0034A07655
MSKSVSLDRKKAYVRKTRAANYLASLRLEGFKTDNATPKLASREALLAKYAVSRK